MRKRYPFYYIGLPAFTLLIIAVVTATADIDAIEWQQLRTILLMLGVVVVVWVGTWHNLRQSYRKNNALRNGAVYHLDEQGISQEGSSLEPVLWSNIARTAVQSGNWIILRQASSTSKETYFLNAAGVVPPAHRTELLALLKRKRIKRI